MSIFYPKVKLPRITHLTPQRMQSLGIRALVLDVDNTLTTHDNPTPFGDIAAWLEERKAEGFPMVILSNNHAERVRPFAEILGLPFIADGKKPLKKGMIEAAQRFDLPPEAIGVVGDQVFTDIWGANRFGAISILVDPLGPETVAFIRFKRRLERLVLRNYRPAALSPMGTEGRADNELI